MLREEYFTQNYNEKWFNEIHKRTQVPDETIYLAVTSGYFNRLTYAVSNQTYL